MTSTMKKMIWPMTSLAKASAKDGITTRESDASFGIMVESKSTLDNFPCDANETLLCAGLRSGLALPYECATGTCGTCRARVMSGDVEIDWEEAPGATRLKRGKGDVLMCQTRPKTDIQLRVPATLDAAGIAPHHLPGHRTGVIEDVRRLTSDVLHFEVALSKPMTFDAGQFVVLRVPGLQGGRAYSMVNYAQKADRIDLVVKRKLGGGFGDWIFDGNRQGQRIDLFGPLGRATFHPKEHKNLLMIAGGSGIAGMMSILARAIDEGYFHGHKGYVFFGVNTLEDGFYLERLNRCGESAEGNLEITLALSNDAVSAGVHPRYPYIRLASGFVHEAMTKAMAGRYQNVISYIAGPPPMVDGALRTLIMDGQLTPDAIRYDKFG